ncbi:MAG: hypothetical protein ACREGE_02495, partial [Candidatus Microsaccharimonas sp.]
WELDNVYRWYNKGMSNIANFKKPVSGATYIWVSIGIVALLVLLHLYMVYGLIPHQQGFVGIYLPARSGGKEFLVDSDEFFIISSIAIAVAAVFAALVIGLLHRNKNRLATILMLWLLVLSSMYLAIFVGNIFDELWGGLWSIVGVAAIAIPALIIEMPLITSMSQSVKRK